MKSLLLALSALILMACSSCAGTLNPPEAYVDQATYLMTESTVRLKVSCSEGGAFVGSGTAIAHDRILTARHVVRACEEENLGYPLQIVAITLAGDEVTMIPEDVSKDHDVATLLSLTDEAPFAVVAPVGGELPKIGDTVWWTGGDGHLDLNGLIKSAIVSATPDEEDGLVMCSGKPSGGNSGSGVWFHGRVIGVLVQGSWNPQYDYIMGYESLNHFQSLL